MAVSCQTIINLMEKYAPKNRAEDWDNVGLQMGSPAQAVSCVFLSLDLNEAILAEALQAGADMLVVHHTPFFKPLKHLRTDLPQGRLLQKIMQQGLALYAAHTNLDATVGGVNDVLAQKLGLQQVELLLKAHPYEEVACDLYALANEGEKAGIGRIGSLPHPCTLQEFIALVKERLDLSMVRYCGDLAKPVTKVAVCGGSGAAYLGRAAFKGADVYLTADLKYHEAQEAQMLGLALVDGGHFGTEQPIIAVVADYLKEELQKEQVQVVTSRLNSDPLSFL